LPTLNFARRVESLHSPAEVGVLTGGVVAVGDATGGVVAVGDPKGVVVAVGDPKGVVVAVGDATGGVVAVGDATGGVVAVGVATGGVVAVGVATGGFAEQLMSFTPSTYTIILATSGVWFVLRLQTSTFKSFPPDQLPYV
jgi:hypothetical protein